MSAALFRRKSSDPETVAAREAFRRVAAELDAAQRTLLASVPTARDPGGPLADALDGFLAGIARVEALMPSWRMPKTESLWQRCSEALTAARTEAQSLKQSQTLDFEALNARLGDVISPLEEFADAAGEIRRLR